jgi:hypothetical protein
MALPQKGDILVKRNAERDEYVILEATTGELLAVRSIA